jgi:hypothetical protein
MSPLSMSTENRGLNAAAKYRGEFIQTAAVAISIDARQTNAFVDQFGRETVSWIRTFESRRTRRFDAHMVHSDARRRIVDYLGSHEHLAVDFDLSVDEAGGLRLRSGAQRFYEGVMIRSNQPRASAACPAPRCASTSANQICACGLG